MQHGPNGPWKSYLIYRPRTNAQFFSIKGKIAVQNARKVEMLFQAKYSLYKCMDIMIMQLKAYNMTNFGIWMAAFNPEKSILR